VRAAYRERLRRPGRTVDHPIAVAELLDADRQPPQVILAGLLHDVLEDTDVRASELEREFGGEVVRLVLAVTQNDAINGYKPRKASLREQTLAAGKGACAIALADKLAKLRALDERPRRRRLEHYRATVEGIESRYGPTRLSALAREQLERWPQAESDQRRRS
jgi:(p)ppGpp synthase/HD superfamily hydrolase